MISKTRSSEIARPRQIAMYLCKTMTSDSLDVIGQLLGGRDHSTIIHGIKKVTKDYEENDSTRTLIETIKKRLIQISFYLFIYVLICMLIIWL